MPDLESLKRRHELRDVPGKLAVGLAALVVVCAIVMHVVLTAGTSWLKRRIPSDDQRAFHLPQSPALESQPQKDMRIYLRTERALLHSYQWVDPQRGTVSIPVERAMEIYAKTHR